MAGRKTKRLVMRKTIEALMADLGCEKWPLTWESFYNDVMDTYDREGCSLTDPSYYERLHKTYGVLPNYLETFKEAAAETGKNEDLSRFLSLLAFALSDRENVKENLKSLSYPKKNWDTSLACRMVQGLALMSTVPYTYGLLKQRNMTDDEIRSAISLLECGIPEYSKRHGGEIGYNLIDWFQLTVDGKLFRIDRLEFEFGAKFYSNAVVYINKNGDRIALAQGMKVHKSGYIMGSYFFSGDDDSYDTEITETENSWIGHTFDEKGRVKRETVTLDRSEWSILLKPGDPVIGVHIPPIGSITPEWVDRTLKTAQKFFEKYYPEYDYKAFTCHSWMMDPQLIDMVGENSNIAKFQRRYDILGIKSNGTGVFGFVFLKPDKNFDLAELPENTTLERKLKHHYMTGNAVYELYGYFLK